MPRVLIEAAVETPADAEAATAGGADRLEVCAALDLGGLTPSPGVVREVQAVSPLPVVLMLRPRPSDFVYTAAEVRVLRHDLDALAPLRPAGFIFGVLHPDGTLNEAACRELIAAAAGVPCVIHRSFDRAPDPAAALETAVALGFRRVLTRGARSTAVKGTLAVARLVELAAGRIEILPCGKVRAANAAEVIRATGCDQLHASFAEPVPRDEGLGYRGYVQRSRTSRAEVEATRAALDALALGLA